MRRGVKQQKGAAYIKISEEEIADDYPMPKQYVMEAEEMDELVVNGDEDMLLDVDPETLPKLVRGLLCACVLSTGSTPHACTRHDAHVAAGD